MLRMTPIVIPKSSDGRHVLFIRSVRFRYIRVLGRLLVVAACVCQLVLLAPRLAVADVKLPAVFSENMVLQRDRAIPVWGWADPGEEVTVRFGGNVSRAMSDDGGRWRVSLPKLSAQPEPLELLVRGSAGSRVSVGNVLIGDVWLCTGPSNIFWQVKRCDNAKQEIADADYPRIRFFTVKKHAADEPQSDCQGDWAECSPETVGDASGVGYFSSRLIHKEQDVPIGLLQSFWGGSRIEAWTSAEAFQAEPALKPIGDWWKNNVNDFDPGEAEADYRRRLAEWKRTVAVAKADGKKPPAKPRKHRNPRRSPHRPACLYNGMIAPLIPYALKGVISYQGLGNLYWADHNRVLLSTLINDWRSRWQHDDMHFGMVQPAPFPCDRWPKQNENAYAIQREAQLLVMDELKNVGVAPTMEIGSLTQLHFTNKQDVGRRMAHWALANVYGRSIAYSGPVYESMRVEGNAIRIHFKHTGEGLSTSDGKAPTHFAIASDDKQFHPAQAVIDGHTVVVSSEQVSQPVAVRFAWSDTAVPNLINSDNLPASLFRTDVPPLKRSADSP